MGTGEPGVGLVQEPTVPAVTVLQMERLVRMVGVVLHRQRESRREGGDSEDESEDAAGKGSPLDHG